MTTPGRRYEEYDRSISFAGMWTPDKEVRLAESYPIEGYQMTIFRADGLANGAHTLTIEVTNTDGAYVVVDAFDVRA